MISFNEPYISEDFKEIISDLISRNKLSGNGHYTNLCQQYFQDILGGSNLLTTSCTDALEMSAILLDIKQDDEVIMPSYTFVSTANAFALRGAKIVFCDSSSDNPNISEENIEALITSKTKAIVAVHYAGVSCNMDKINEIARKYNIFVVEDVAQAIFSEYKNKRCGTLSDLSAFSFHETKNIISGEGGLLQINNSIFKKRAEIIWEKGTNRTSFLRGEVKKYEWVDIGSSFLPSELNAAMLYSQLLKSEYIQKRRNEIWNSYNEGLKRLEEEGLLALMKVPDYATHNAHIFYFLAKNINKRNQLIDYLREKEIYALFHYQSLHKSPYFLSQNTYKQLPNAERFEDCLLRLPLHLHLSDNDINQITETIYKFYGRN
ncbi:MAG: dTDP-4-amino-4,6-dideoxygalactose transaminase [Bacteroidota bacterium]